MEHANKWIAAQKKINIIYPSGKSSSQEVHWSWTIND